MGSEEIYYEVAQQRLDGQLASIDGLDNKAATAFAFASGVLAFFGALLAVTSLGPDRVLIRPLDVPISHRAILIALFVLGCIVYVRIVYLLQRAYRVQRTWSNRPQLEVLENECRTHDKEYMRLWMARQCRASFEANRLPLLDKADKVQGALNLLPIEAALAAATGLVALLAK